MSSWFSFHPNAILTFGLILVFGYIAGKIANLLKLPKVTGYITAGVLLEPAMLGIIPVRLIEHSTVISNFALCIITYAIGGSLFFKKIKELGNTIWVMTVFESIMTFFMIAAGLFVVLEFLGRFAGVSIPPALYLPLAIFAGSLGAPTDPTPTLAVKEEFKADGPVTTTILGIGAFDDAMGIMIFSLAMAIGSALVGGAISTGAMFLDPVLDIIFSMLVGGVFAFLLLAASRKVEDKGVMVVLILGTLFACFGVAQAFDLDELLSTMVLGCVVVNLAKDQDKFFLSIRDYFEEMVFVVFFVLAGAQLDLGVLKSSLFVVAVFVIFRILGKITGAYIGAVVSGARAEVKKYTAFGLIPQGGIVVGLALLVKQDPQFSNISSILLNMVLGTTILFEFIGPLLTELALKWSKETQR